MKKPYAGGPKHTKDQVAAVEWTAPYVPDPAMVAAAMADGGVNAEQAEAWQAVCAALTAAYPDWLDGSKRGLDCAVKAIQELAAKAQDKGPLFSVEVIDGKTVVEPVLPVASRDAMKAAKRPQTSNIQIKMVVNGENLTFDGSWLKELAL